MRKTLNGREAASTSEFGRRGPTRTAISGRPRTYRFVALIALFLLVGLDALSICQAQSGEIRGHVFLDGNCNGVFDSWETGLAGWDIRLSGTSNAVANTDATGAYSFVGLGPGTYSVAVTTQPGWVLTAPAGGSHTVNLSDGIAEDIDFLNCSCPMDELLPPPPCTIAWLPLDDGTGAVASETIGGNFATLQGGPSWVAGSAAAALRFASGADFAELASSQTPSFAFGSFSISLWFRSDNSDGLRRTLIDKRSSTGGLTGFQLYIDNNRLGLQLASAGAFTDYASSGTVLTDDAWHHLVVIVCRDLDPAGDGITFFVDGALDAQWSATAVLQANIDNNVRLRLGQNSAGLPPAFALDATLDEVLLYDCCLSFSEVLRVMGGIASADAHLPSAVTPCGSTGKIPFRICNYSPFSRTFTWTLAGRPGCDVAGPEDFQPSSGTIVLPPGPACQTVQSIVQVPSWLTGTNLSCFELSVFEHETARCFRVPTGVLRGPGFLCPDPDPAIFTPVQQTFLFSFDIENGTPDMLTVELQLYPWSSENDAPSGSLGLDGLPPGEPIVRTVKIPPEGTISVGGEGELGDFDPADVQQIRLFGDLFGDGVPLLMTDIPVYSVLEIEPADAPDPPSTVPTPSVGWKALPNPFREMTRVEMASPDSDVGSIRIVDASGRNVRSLDTMRTTAEGSVIEWDGRDDAGRAVANGVYWILPTSPSESSRPALRVIRVR